MTEKVTFEPDVASLAIADPIVKEQGLTLEEVAAEAFSAYMQGAQAARDLDLDEQRREW